MNLSRRNLHTCTIICVFMCCCYYSFPTRPSKFGRQRRRRAVNLAARCSGHRISARSVIIIIIKRSRERGVGRSRDFICCKFRRNRRCTRQNKTYLYVIYYYIIYTHLLLGFNNVYTLHDRPNKTTRHS